MSDLVDLVSEVSVSDGHIDHARYGRLQWSREMDTVGSERLHSHLWRLIYLDFYCGDRVAAQVLADGGNQVVGLAQREDAALVESFIAAVSSRHTRSTGWRVVETEPELRVARHGLTLTIGPQHLPGDMASVAVTDEVDLHLPPVNRYTYPGWMIVHGEAGSHRGDASSLARHYFAVNDPRSAHRLIAEVTEQFNQAGMPFHLKVANNRDGLKRRDAVIVYVAVTDEPSAMDVFRRYHARHHGELRAHGPRLTQAMGRGWARAPEPRGVKGMSYGQHRCSLIASGLIAAPEADATTRLRAVRDALEAAGVDPDRPWAEDRA